MFKIGAGYQPMNFQDDDAIKLPLAKQVSLVEAGLGEYKRACSRAPEEVFFSLHLARTPITESAAIQDEFIDYLISQINPKKTPISIGLHLTNPRGSGIGKYGFSSHYVPSQKHEDLACRFIERLQSKTSLSVWLENSNFYSESPLEVMDTWNSFSRIVELSNTFAIVDLSHLLIDAKNISLNPVALLGCAPWKRVRELHLSGFVVGRDGTYHDGHSSPVHEEVWNLLDLVLSNNFCSFENTYFTIEHTDPTWARQRALYEKDFAHLEQRLISKTREKAEISAFKSADTYARTFLKKMVLRQIPKLSEACDQRGISVEELFDSWVSQVLNQENRRILLTAEEVPFVEVEKHAVAASDFLRFSKERLNAHETRS